MYKTIAFDVDGVMADLVGQYVTYYNRIHEDDQISKEQIVDYDFIPKLKYKDCLWNIPGFVETIPMFPEVRKYFLKIIENYDAIVVTACSVEKYVERIHWFKTLIPEFDTNLIFFAQDKTRINFDVIIDDSPSNIEDVGGERAVMFVHPYNQHHTVAKHRVTNWKEIYEWVVTHCEPKRKLDIDSDFASGVRDKVAECCGRNNVKEVK